MMELTCVDLHHVFIPHMRTCTFQILLSSSCAANPSVDTVLIKVDGSPVTSDDTVTVTDNVLTIPSVQRNHSGNYSCTATNTRGSAAIYHNLLVVGVYCLLFAGERVTLRAFAVNSVGTSNPVFADVIVPCELWMYSVLP